MKTQGKLLNIIGGLIFTYSTVATAHIKCPYTIFGKTNDSCPLHSHPTIFVENKGSKSKDKASPKRPIFSKPTINLPTKLKSLSKPKLPSLDYRAIDSINDVSEKTQRKIQRESSRLNKNFKTVRVLFP